MKGLKIQRIKADLTQEELAQKANFTVRQIRSWEQGRRNPKSKALKNLALFFNCTIEELL